MLSCDGTGSRAIRCNRRLFLTSLLALGACGFRPVYGPGGAAEGLRGAVSVAAPKNRDEYELVKQLEERLGQPNGARYALAYQIKVRTRGIGVTPSNETTRTQITGTATFSVTDTATGQVAYSGSVTSFTSFSNQRSTVSTVAVKGDAHRRLMVALADLMVTRLIATGPDWLA